MADVRARPYEALKAFLADPRRPEGTFQYHELQGFLFTIAGAPELVRPSEWMPVVFADGSAGYETLEEAQLILGELMSLYNGVNAGVVDEKPTLPPDCRWRRDVLANLDEKAPVAQWSRGFLAGHRWLEDSWDIVPDELSDDFGLTLMALTFFASPTLAEAYLKETKAASLEGFGKAMRRIHRNAMREYAWLGRTIQQLRAEQDAEQARAEQQPVKRTQPKVGRNEPCPCGSGRKFKKCCGAVVH
jgi:uncharacterized protein